MAVFFFLQQPLSSSQLLYYCGLPKGLKFDARPQTGAYSCSANTDLQALYQSTMSTDSVWIELWLGGGTNCTLRCDFGDGTSVISVEGLHTSYTGLVVDR